MHKPFVIFYVNFENYHSEKLSTYRTNQEILILLVSNLIFLDITVKKYQTRVEKLLKH
jgi:hypothetical protein